MIRLLLRPWHKPVRYYLSLPLLLATLFTSSAATVPGARSHESLRNEIQRALDKGASWLSKNQDPAGFWTTADHPAITSLALVALRGRNSETAAPEEKKAIEKGYQFVLASVRPDGSIARKEELLNYNTAVSMMALLAANRAEYNPVILKARQFLVGLQSDFGDKGSLDNPLDGGIGYGSRYPHSDMSNTLMALEAIYHSRKLASDSDTAVPAGADLNWGAAIHFLQNCQNLPSHNPQPWASGDPENKGGFVYFPGHSMAGETNLPNGRVALRSYGSISYAGLLSYIYADLKKEDPRVQAVLEWLRNNFTLDENPGMGPQGIYYYLHTMTKALTKAEVETLKLKDGRTIDWRPAVALKLINLQRTDGSWQNENARWWEKDSALVTAYSLIALEMIHRQL